MYTIYFFFSSRRRHTRLQGDWSSDVCSSDLRSSPASTNGTKLICRRALELYMTSCWIASQHLSLRSSYSYGYLLPGIARSEERRVGKECRSRWSPYH